MIIDTISTENTFDISYLSLEVCRSEYINSNRIFRDWFRESEHQVRSKRYTRSTEHQKSASLIDQVKRLWSYREHLRIRAESQELSEASSTISAKKLDNQSKSEEILSCLKSTLRRRSLIDDSVVQRRSFFSSSSIFLNFRCIIFFQQDSINSCCFCRWAALAKVSLSSAWRRACFLQTRSHSVSEMIRSHLRSRCIHSTQWSKSASTRHFTKRLKQWLQRRITELSLKRSFFERRRRFATELDDLNIWFKYIETKISENRNLEENLVLEHDLNWDRNYNIERSLQHDELWSSKDHDHVLVIRCEELLRSWSDSHDSESESTRSLSDSDDCTNLLCLYNDDCFLR